jgi:hypothetical protein
MEENFGEDPFHVGKMGVGSTVGLQGRGCGGANVTLAKDKISAQAKHFAVYGAGGRDGSDLPGLVVAWAEQVPMAACRPYRLIADIRRWAEVSARLNFQCCLAPLVYCTG